MLFLATQKHSPLRAAWRRTRRHLQNLVWSSLFEPSDTWIPEVPTPPGHDITKDAQRETWTVFQGHTENLFVVDEMSFGLHVFGTVPTQ